MLRIAARRSPLARAQAELVADLLRAAEPGLAVEYVLLASAGDLDRTRPVDALGQQGVFTRAVQAALLDGRADLAVHSFKDVPTAPLEGLRVAAVPPRADPRDALVSASGAGLRDLPRGARVGTGSARRRAQVLRVRPDLSVRPLRGNVGTRAARVRAGALDAAVLALAGLRRLGLDDVIAQVLEPPDFVPAPAQGALAVEVRRGRTDLAELLRGIDHAPSRAAAAAERAFLQALRGGCNAPAAALARLADGVLTLTAARYDLGSGEPCTVSGQAADAELLGREAAARLLDGAGEGSG